eukprot:gb/GECH01000824.1/.p1 GENE.gb/GECH01000824.1/~~gb/GECH01000824.1/.p1  ORF type:complete len:309 (+),score=65.86 gb/GECH01000824.1/:1-927(+)
MLRFSSKKYSIPNPTKHGVPMNAIQNAIILIPVGLLDTKQINLTSDNNFGVSKIFLMEHVDLPKEHHSLFQERKMWKSVNSIELGETCFHFNYFYNQLEITQKIEFHCNSKPSFTTGNHFCFRIEFHNGGYLFSFPFATLAKKRTVDGTRELSTDLRRKHFSNIGIWTPPEKNAKALKVFSPQPHYSPLLPQHERENLNSEVLSETFPIDVSNPCEDQGYESVSENDVQSKPSSSDDPMDISFDGFIDVDDVLEPLKNPEHLFSNDPNHTSLASNALFLSAPSGSSYDTVMDVEELFPDTDFHDLWTP